MVDLSSSLCNCLPEGTGVYKPTYNWGGLTLYHIFDDLEAIQVGDDEEGDEDVTYVTKTWSSCEFHGIQLHHHHHHHHHHIFTYMWMS